MCDRVRCFFHLGSDGRGSGRRLAAASAGTAPSGLLVVGLSLTVSVDVGPVMGPEHMTLL